MKTLKTMDSFRGNETLEVSLSGAWVTLAIRDPQYHEFNNINVDRAELLEALGAVEKPAPAPAVKPTNKAVRDSLPNGSVIRFNDEQGTWHKVDRKWLNSRAGGALIESVGSWEEPLWIQHVVFNPKEATR